MLNEDDQVQLNLPSHPKYMGMVRALVEQGSQMAGFGEEDAMAIRLAVDEACTNVIRHCYNNDYTQPIIVFLSVQGRELRIALRDFGPKQDCSQFKSRDLEDIKPGGLGMHFIYSTMDQVEFDESLARGTLLRMSKTAREPLGEGATEDPDQDQESRP